MAKDFPSPYGYLWLKGAKEENEYFSYKDPYIFLGAAVYEGGVKLVRLQYPENLSKQVTQPSNVPLNHQIKSCIWLSKEILY